MGRPVSVERETLLAYLADRLDLTMPDYGPNGLQVQGVQRIERVVTGVSACVELFAKAVEWDAQAVLVHHGIFWDGMPSVLTGVQHRRVKALIDANLNLFAYHLPLDAHPEVGNNAVAAARLGLVEVQPFGEHKGQDIGFRGQFPEPISPDQLVSASAEAFGQDPLAFLEGPESVRTLGIISGGAQNEFHQAIDAGLDAYITGEASEWVMNWARESGTHYLAAGHHATERLGVQALGEELARKLDVEVRFFDVPNPV